MVESNTWLSGHQRLDGFSLSVFLLGLGFVLVRRCDLFFWESHAKLSASDRVTVSSSDLWGVNAACLSGRSDADFHTCLCRPTSAVWWLRTSDIRVQVLITLDYCDILSSVNSKCGLLTWDRLLRLPVVDTNSVGKEFGPRLTLSGSDVIG